MTMKFWIGLGLAAAIATGGNALAQTNASRAEVRQTTVLIKDLDLDTKDGMKTFMRRLNNAAAKVCGPAPDNRDLDGGIRFSACTTQAKTDAVARFGNAQISAAFNGELQRDAALDGLDAQPKG